MHPLREDGVTIYCTVPKPDKVWAIADPHEEEHGLAPVTPPVIVPIDHEYVEPIGVLVKSIFEGTPLHAPTELGVVIIGVPYNVALPIMLTVQPPEVALTV